LSHYYPYGLNPDAIYTHGGHPRRGYACARSREVAIGDADAPLQSCDFRRGVRRSGVGAVAAYYEPADRPAV
jgi:hypothetical protein